MREEDGIGVAPTALALPRRGLVVLKNVIQLLREEARFVDEEGDDTNALDELLEALCAYGVTAARTELWDAIAELVVACGGSAAQFDEAIADRIDAAARGVLAVDQRQAFEAWAAREGYPVNRERFDADVYQDPRTHAAWWAWKEPRGVKGPDDAH